MTPMVAHAEFLVALAHLVPTAPSRGNSWGDPLVWLAVWAIEHNLRRHFDTLWLSGDARAALLRHPKTCETMGLDREIPHFGTVR